jgi:hypothetical protein
MEKVALHYEDISKRRPRFQVSGEFADRSAVLGTIEYIFIRHLKQHGWNATGVDGSHRAVHEHKWQAALALAWVGADTSYPNPIRRPAWLAAEPS